MYLYFNYILLFLEDSSFNFELVKQLNDNKNQIFIITDSKSFQKKIQDQFPLSHSAICDFTNSSDIKNARTQCLTHFPNIDIIIHQNQKLCINPQQENNENNENKNSIIDSFIAFLESLKPTITKNLQSALILFKFYPTPQNKTSFFSKKTVNHWQENYFERVSEALLTKRMVVYHIPFEYISEKTKLNSNNKQKVKSLLVNISLKKYLEEENKKLSYTKFILTIQQLLKLK